MKQGDHLFPSNDVRIHDKLDIIADTVQWDQVSNDPSLVGGLIITGFVFETVIHRTLIGSFY